jgi:hypothetical protein
VRKWLILASLAPVCIGGCNSTQGDWRLAHAQDTIPAYRRFLDEHPNAVESVQARHRIRALEDDAAWAKVEAKGTTAAYTGYLVDRPGGVHAVQAHRALASMERSQAWASAQSAGTVAAYQQFVQQYPVGRDADQARAMLAQLNGYEVQLGSFRSRTSAERQRNRLEKKFGQGLGGLTLVHTPANDKPISLRSKPMSEVAAERICAELQKSHQPCELLRARRS